MNELRTDAERLRDQGYSYNMIREALGVARSTMSYWFKDRPFTPNKEVLDRIKYNQMQAGAKRHNDRVRQTAEMRQSGIEEIGKLSGRDLWMLGLGLYIGEGAKTIETLRVANSNPAVIATMIKWFKESLGLANENIMIHLHLYPDSEIEKSLLYWEGVTGLPRANFRKTIIDTRQNKKQNKRGKLPYGTAHLRVACRGDTEKGVKLYRRVNGWIAGALEQL